jgi:hypothetical protein
MAGIRHVRGSLSGAATGPSRSRCRAAHRAVDEVVEGPVEQGDAEEREGCIPRCR